MQGRVSSAAAAYLVQDGNLQNSDLQPGKYEGTLCYPELLSVPAGLPDIMMCCQRV